MAQEIQFQNSFEVQGTIKDVKSGVTQRGTLWVRVIVRTVQQYGNGEDRVVNVPVAAFGRPAVGLKDLEPGTQVVMTGKLRSRTHTTKDGEERYQLDATAEEVAVVE